MSVIIVGALSGFICFLLGILVERQRNIMKGTLLASHNKQNLQDYSCACGYWMSTIEYRKGTCPSCGKIVSSKVAKRDFSE